MVISKTVICIAGVAAVAGLILAQEGPREGGRGPGGGSVLVGALDTDGDGAISGKEMKAAPASLKKLDKNGDGKLTAEELRWQGGDRERGEGRGEGRGAGQAAAGASPDELLQTLLAFDKNKDGKLQKDEVPDRMQGLFTRGDTNKDGILTASEIRGLATTQAASAPDRGGRGEGRGEGRGGGRGGMMRMDPVAAALDADHDGVISAAEIKNANNALKTLDKNDDGQLSRDEIRPNFGRGRGGSFGGTPEEMSARIFQQLDGNKDGKLSRHEMSEGPFGELFDRADTNKDGFVSQAELLAAMPQGGFGRGRGQGERPRQ